MSELRMIPGPDPGACPECGGWIRAGVIHDCDEHRRHDIIMETASCFLHGDFYAGFATCPTCDAMREPAA